MKKIVGKVLSTDGILGCLLLDDKNQEYIKNEQEVIQLITDGEISNASLDNDNCLVIDEVSYIKDLSSYSIHKQRIADNLVFTLTDFIMQKYQKGDSIEGYRFKGKDGKVLDIYNKDIRVFLKTFKVTNIEVRMRRGTFDRTITNFSNIGYKYLDEIDEPQKEEKSFESTKEIEIQPKESLIGRREDVVFTIKRGRLRIAGQEKTVLVLYDVDKLMTANVNSKIHYIHLIDSSSSMRGDIDNLKVNIKESILGMEQEDKVSVIEFNTSGNSKILLENTLVSEINSLIDRIDTIRADGKTCFSEPIKIAGDIVRKYEGDGYTVCISLFTDGEAVVDRDIHDEHNSCYNTVSSLSDKVIAFNTLGYCNRYNEVFLRKLASMTYLGKFTHASNINRFSESFKHSYLGLKEAKMGKLEIETKGKILCVSSLNTVNKDNKLKIDAIGKDSKLIIILDNENENVVINGHSMDSIKNLDELNTEEYKHTVYSIANATLYSDDKEYAVEALKNIKDYKLAAEVNSAYTKEEKQKAKDRIVEVLADKNHRFVGDKLTRQLGNEYCLVDLFNELKDNNSYIDSESFKEYSRIGVKVFDKNNKFTSLRIEPVPFSTIKYNSKRANMSIGFVYSGYVELDKGLANEQGLQYIFPDYRVKCKKIRNYSILKDGELNIESIVVHVTEGCYQSLRLKPTLKEKLVTSCETSSIVNGQHRYKKITLNLKAIPVLNSNYVGNNDFSTVYEDYMLLCKSKARRKILNSFIGSLEGYQRNDFEVFNLEQIEVLEKHGINSKLEYVGVNNEHDTENLDYYYAKEYDFKIRGASKIPSVEDAIEARNNGNYKRDVYMEAMVDYLNYLDSFKDKPFEDKLRIYKFHLEKIDRFIKTLESKLNIQKMARILTDSIWSGLQKGTKSDYEFSGAYGDLLLNIKEEKIPYTIR